MITRNTRQLSRRDLLASAGAASLIAGLSVSRTGSVARAAAPALGASRSPFYRFRFGEFEVTTLRDGAVYPKGPYPSFGAAQFQEDVDDLVKENFLPTDRFELSFAPVVVNSGKELILFDSGNGAAGQPERGRLRTALETAGYTPEQVDLVVLTHCHPDHIGGLMENGTAVFPNARYVIGDSEYAFWSPKGLAENNDPVGRRAKVVQDQVVPLAEKMTFLKQEGEVAPGIHAVGSPGHTPGHLSFHIESAGKRLLLLGDAIVHFVISFQRPDWQLAADMDHDSAAASRERLLDMASADGLLITGYHLPFPALGYVDRLDEGYRYVPVGYQLEL